MKYDYAEEDDLIVSLANVSDEEAHNFKRQRSLALFFEWAFKSLTLLATVIPLVFLAALLAKTLFSGIARLDIDFLLSFPSRFAHKSGILPSLLGTFYLMIVTALIALPLGIAAAIYLEEYAKDSWLKSLIEVNVSNLAAVPSVIFGLLGLEIFVRACGLGPSLLAAALTLSLLLLPVIVSATRESLKMVPLTLREAGCALGGSKLSVIVRIVLPMAMSQIITGAILALARAIGETAPLIVIGAATYIAFVPKGILSEFSALPLQIFQWVERPQKEFVDNAAAAIVVLLMILVFFNGLAAFMRHRHEKKRGIS
jgi:phosphate transport system permease protein